MVLPGHIMAEAQLTAMLRALRGEPLAPVEVKVKVKDPCPTCEGTGKAFCDRCDGQGEVECTCDCGDTHERRCRACDSKGRSKTEHCDDCNGTGKGPEVEIVEPHPADAWTLRAMGLH